MLLEWKNLFISLDKDLFNVYQKQSPSVLKKWKNLGAQTQVGFFSLNQSS